ISAFLYRLTFNANVWGAADGTSPWDLNDTATYNGITPINGVYASGTYTGSNAGLTFSLSGLPAPTANCWAGFTIRNLSSLARGPTPDWFGLITTNTVDSSGSTT